MQLLGSIRTIAVLLCLTMTVPPVGAQAQAAPTGSISGTIRSSDGAPIAGAQVTVAGSITIRTTSDDKGAFSASNLALGIYQVTVGRASFVTTSRSDVVVAAGSTTSLVVVMQPISFSSLAEIGRVAGAGGQASSINTTTAAITTVPGSVFSDQGVQQVTQVLNQIPGVTVTTDQTNTTSNPALMNSPVIPQLRGSLPYETESLIDGHPVSVGANGYFSPIYINPNQLESVEVVKGPGAMPVDINYAVGGSVNYVTLQPTFKPHASLTFDKDNFGGLSTNMKATGSALNGRIGYAVALGINGTPGPLAGPAYNVFGFPVAAFNGIATANGVPICGTYSAGASCLVVGVAPTPPGYYNNTGFDFPIIACCNQLSSQYLSRTELAKLRFNFSAQTSLTVAYLGGQSTSASLQVISTPNQFQPPTGYTGSIPAGTSFPEALDTWYPDTLVATQGLFESELRTSLGKASSLLFRYYTGANDSSQTYVSEPYTFTAATWGGLPIGIGGANVFFNGTPVTYTTIDAGTQAISLDHFSGLSGEYDLTEGANLYTLSADRTQHDSYSGTTAQLPGENSTLLPNGTSQALSTVMVKGEFALTHFLTATLANYFVNYTTHYTPDGGMTWGDASQSFYGPRLAFLYSPNSSTSVRLATGSSIAPPYLALVNTQGGAPTPNISGAPTFYTQVVNNGNIKPETAFGYDLGADHRLAQDTVVSGDVYLTNVKNQFLNTVSANGTYTGANSAIGGTAPLYVQTTFNLGQSRYEGVELSLHKSPAAGFGYKIQGDLERAYAYDLPPGFYNTAAGPFTTNLAVIPNVNFQPSTLAFNGSSPGRIPYATGYAEVNYRSRRGALFLIGTQYLGNNNAYNFPAFFTVNATARYPIASFASFQVSALNLTSVHDSPIVSSSGVPVALANGLLGSIQGLNIGPTVVHFDLILKI